ncbi:MAG: hypothetical protein NC394_00575 [Bacteroides sp.]|nr:hypothetical protein [Bacteroides sp.]
MASYIVLFNPLAGNGKGEEEAKRLNELLKEDDLQFYDMTKISDYGEFFDSLSESSRLVVAGGDGTLNRFVNAADERYLSRDVYYYATGTGNDFLLDVGGKKGDAPFKINKYIVNLPTVTVNGVESKFINGVGYGIDGYCCEEGDRLRQIPGKKVDYTAIAIKGLLGKYSPVNAVVTVDGKRHEYKKAWLAPTMNGRFYGGGIMPAPKQDRLNNSTVSTMIFYGSGRLRTLAIFPTIFKGEHVKHTKVIEIFRGKEITVSFDRPTALQIDGETVLGATEYTVRVCGGRANDAEKEKETAAAT